jgi:hypothetical protein
VREHRVSGPLARGIGFVFDRLVVARQAESGGADRSFSAARDRDCAVVGSVCDRLELIVELELGFEICP